MWRKLPAIELAGTLLPLMMGGVLHWMAAEPVDASTERQLQLLSNCIGGVIIFHWTMVLTAAVRCAIVLVMKGPGCTADSYRVSHSDKPCARPETAAKAEGYRDVARDGTSEAPLPDRASGRP